MRDAAQPDAERIEGFVAVRGDFQQYAIRDTGYVVQGTPTGRARLSTSKLVAHRIGRTLYSEPGTWYAVLPAIREYTRSSLAHRASGLSHPASRIPHPASRIPHPASRHYRADGRVTVNVEPTPSSLRTVMSPPIARARSRLIARPSPTPSSLVTPPPTCTNGSKTRSR